MRWPVVGAADQPSAPAMPAPIGAVRRVAVAFDELALASDPEARRGFSMRQVGATQQAHCVLEVRACWMRPPRVAGAPSTPRHGVPVVGVCELGVVMVAAVVLGTFPAGAVVVGTATGAVVVGTATGAVVVGPGPDADVVDVPGARVAGGIDRSAPATTTPTDVLAPCRGRLPNKLASGCRAIASTPVIAPTAIPKASIAATATRRQRIGWGRAMLAPSSFAPVCSPARRRNERRADEGPFDPEE
jgi:hypothetical protein